MSIHGTRPQLVQFKSDQAMHVFANFVPNKLYILGCVLQLFIGLTQQQVDAVADVISYREAYDVCDLLVGQVEKVDLW
ncbi:hypothetical protein ACM14_08485 [Delftia sp. JD2]|nr:hypothetical protein ACM14_08485 [Delftia sp. JD2]